MDYEKFKTVFNKLSSEEKLIVGKHIIAMTLARVSSVDCVIARDIAKEMSLSEEEITFLEQQGNSIMADNLQAVFEV